MRRRDGAAHTLRFWAKEVCAAQCGTARGRACTSLELRNSESSSMQVQMWATVQPGILLEPATKGHANEGRCLRRWWLWRRDQLQPAPVPMWRWRMQGQHSLLRSWWSNRRTLWRFTDVGLAHRPLVLQRGQLRAATLQQRRGRGGAAAGVLATTTSCHQLIDDASLLGSVGL